MNALEARLRIINDFLPLLTIPALKDACSVVLDHKHFVRSYGSYQQHHSYEGGLAVHTAEVTEYAVKMAAMFPWINAANAHRSADINVVVTAAVFHDFMKIHDYIGEHKAPYRNLVRHVAGSHAAFMKAVDGKDVNATTVMHIEHAILAHHGRLEWGSPVEPQLVEAFIVHDADVFSMNFGQGK